MTFVGLLVIIITFTVILSPFLLPIPSPTTLRPTSPVSSFPVEDHLVETPTLDHNGRAAAKPTIGARQRRICVSAYSLLPVPSCAAKTSHPVSHPHNTLVCNHTSHFTPTISILAISCLSGTCRWASPRQPLRTELPSTFTHTLAKYTKEPWLYPPPPHTKERSCVGRA